MAYTLAGVEKVIRNLSPVAGAAAGGLRVGDLGRQPRSQQRS